MSYAGFPSIDDMTRGAEAFYYQRYTSQSNEASVPVYRQLQPVEPPLLENINTPAYLASRHPRYYTNVTDPLKYHYVYPRQQEHHQGPVSDQTTCVPPQKVSTRSCTTEPTHSPYYEQQDSEDSSSGCQTPPPPHPAVVRLQGNSKGKYPCSFCHKSFSRPSSLRTHTFTHTGEKPFMCKLDDCPTIFNVKSNMRRHMRVTHNERPALLNKLKKNIKKQ